MEPRKPGGNQQERAIAKPAEEEVKEVRAPKATKSTVRVLEALLARPMEERYGFDLLKETELQSGTLYPILIRFERLGWLTSTWDESNDSGPRRRLYRLTAQGEPAARQLVAKAENSAHPLRAGLGFPLPSGSTEG